MRFVTFQLDANIEPGVLVGGQIIGLHGAGFESVLSVIEGGADALDRVTRWVQHPLSSELPDMAAVALRAPIPRPPKIICIGLNYRDHAAESKMPIPEVPTVFSKPATRYSRPSTSRNQASPRCSKLMVFSFLAASGALLTEAANKEDCACTSA